MKKKVNLILFFSVLITFVFISCSKNKEEDLFKTANEDYKNQNIESAIRNFEKLVSENPYSEYAPESFFTLGHIYQTMEGDSIHRIEFSKKAIEYYNQLVSNFPNHEKSPEAVFMIAYLNAEVVKDFKTAELYYKKFLKMYPDHELAESARLEIQYLGKSPEEILKLHGVIESDQKEKAKLRKTRTAYK